MADGLSSAEGAREQRAAGVEARQSGDHSVLWQDFAELSGGRVGVVIGSCADPGDTRRLRAATSSLLRRGADPAEVVRGAESASASVLAAVIDQGASEMSYGSSGSAALALAAPDLPLRLIAPAAGRLESMELPAGAAVLLSTCATAPFGPWTTSNERIFDDLLTGSGTSGDDAVLMIYRQPPPPLELTVPAEPASLAVLRGHLRGWLVMTGAGDEACADILLAVGEAATNAAEHAHSRTGNQVQITLTAHLTGGILRFMVSDNGSWLPPTPSNGNRGHGIRLMKALADRVDITTTSEGTTVHMLKELAG